VRVPVVLFCLLGGGLGLLVAVQEIVELFGCVEMERRKRETGAGVDAGAEGMGKGREGTGGDWG